MVLEGQAVDGGGYEDRLLERVSSCSSKMEIGSFCIPSRTISSMAKQK